MDKEYYDDSMRMDDAEKLFEQIKKECDGCEAWSGTDCTRNPTTESCLKEKTYESVNHPNHYHPGDYEAIKVIEAWLGPEGCYYFCMGNAIKYISRLDKKPSAGKSKNEKTIEDIGKANWYLDYAKKMKSKIS